MREAVGNGEKEAALAAGGRGPLGVGAGVRDFWYKPPLEENLQRSPPPSFSLATLSIRGLSHLWNSDPQRGQFCSPVPFLIILGRVTFAYGTSTTVI